MENGWQDSAAAWVADMGEHGDFGRRYVLDPVMLPRALAPTPARALDVGCGEGRFCRMLGRHGVPVVGVDPTPALLAVARARDARGSYVEGRAERLPFADASFDLVVSYLTLIDMPDSGAAIPEMARVLRPGGAVLIANLNGFNTACGDQGWVKDEAGRRLHYPLDHYLRERAMWIEDPRHPRRQSSPSTQLLHAGAARCRARARALRRTAALGRGPGLAGRRLRPCPLVPGHGVAEAQGLALSRGVPPPAWPLPRR